MRRLWMEPLSSKSGTGHDTTLSVVYDWNGYDVEMDMFVSGRSSQSLMREIMEKWIGDAKKKSRHN